MVENPHAHILIIEDDPGIATSLRRGLEREGFQVTWKDTGEAGVDFAQKHAPALIILDVRLPDGSGFDFCRRTSVYKTSSFTPNNLLHSLIYTERVIVSGITETERITSEINLAFAIGSLSVLFKRRRVLN